MKNEKTSLAVILDASVIKIFLFCFVSLILFLVFVLEIIIGWNTWENYHMLNQVLQTHLAFKGIFHLYTWLVKLNTSGENVMVMQLCEANHV